MNVRRGLINGLLVLMVSTMFPASLLADEMGGLTFPDPGPPKNIEAGWIKTDAGFTVVVKWEPSNPAYKADDGSDVVGDTASYKVRREPAFSDKEDRIVTNGLGVDQGNWSEAGALHDGFIFMDHDTEREKTYTYFVSAIDSQTGESVGDEISASVPIKPDDDVCPDVKLYGSQLSHTQVRFFWPEICDANEYKLTVDWTKAGTDENGHQEKVFTLDDKREFNTDVPSTIDDFSYVAKLEAWYRNKKNPNRDRKVGDDTLAFTIHKIGVDEAYKCEPAEKPEDHKFADGYSVPSFDHKTGRVTWFPTEELWNPYYPAHLWGDWFSISPMNSIIEVGDKVHYSVSNTGAVGPWKDHEGDDIAYRGAIGSWKGTGVAYWIDAMGPRTGVEFNFVKASGSLLVNAYSQTGNDILIGTKGYYVTSQKRSQNNGEDNTGVEMWMDRGTTEDITSDQATKLAHMDVADNANDKTISYQKFTPGLLGPLEMSGYNLAGTCGALKAPHPIVGLLELRTAQSLVHTSKDQQIVKVKVKAVKVKYTGEEELLGGRSILVGPDKDDKGKAIDPIIDAVATLQQNLVSGQKETTILTDGNGEATVYVRTDRTKGGRVKFKDSMIDKTDKLVKIDPLPPTASISANNPVLQSAQSASDLSLSASHNDGSLASDTDINVSAQPNFNDSDQGTLALAKNFHPTTTADLLHLDVAKADNETTPTDSSTNVTTPTSDKTDTSVGDQPNQDTTPLVKNADGSVIVRTDALGKAKVRFSPPASAFANYTEAIRTYTLTMRWTDTDGTVHQDQTVLPLQNNQPIQLTTEIQWPEETEWVRPDGTIVTNLESILKAPLPPATSADTGSIGLTPTSTKLASAQLKPNGPSIQLAGARAIVPVGGSSGGGSVPTAPNEPIVTFTATPWTITEGESTQLAWQVNNAKKVTFQGQTVDPTGSTVVTPMVDHHQTDVQYLNGTKPVVVQNYKLEVQANDDSMRDYTVGVVILIFQPRVPAGTVVPIKVSAYRQTLDSIGNGEKIPVQQFHFQGTVNGWRLTDIAADQQPNDPNRNHRYKLASDHRWYKYSTETADDLVSSSGQTDLVTDQLGEAELNFTVPANLYPDQLPNQFNLNLTGLDKAVDPNGQRVAARSTLINAYLRQLMVTSVPVDIQSQTAATAANPNQLNAFVQEVNPDGAQGGPIGQASVLFHVDAETSQLLDLTPTDLANLLVTSLRPSYPDVVVVPGQPGTVEIPHATDGTGHLLLNFPTPPSLRFPDFTWKVTLGATKAGYNFYDPTSKNAPTTTLSGRPTVTFHVTNTSLKDNQVDLKTLLTTPFGDAIDWYMAEKALSNHEPVENLAPLYAWLPADKNPQTLNGDQNALLSIAPVASSLSLRGATFSVGAAAPQTTVKLLANLQLPPSSGYGAVKADLFLDLSKATASSSAANQSQKPQAEPTNLALAATVTCGPTPPTNPQYSCDHINDDSWARHKSDFDSWFADNNSLPAWIQLNWKDPQTIGQVNLYNITGGSGMFTYRGTLSFSDGTTVPVDQLLHTSNTPLTVNLPSSKTVTWVRFTITVPWVEPNLFWQSGLSEMQVYPALNVAPLAKLTCTSEAPDGKPDTVSYNHSDEFNYQGQYYKSDPFSSLYHPNGACSNLTDGISAQLSEWHTGRALNQFTYDPLTGTFKQSQDPISFQLDWPTDQTIDTIKLYQTKDAGNTIVAGTLIFSDGSTVLSGTLPTDGTAKVLSFPTKTVRWVRYVIDNTSRPYDSINGLNEFEAYSPITTEAVATPTPSASPTVSASVEPSASANPTETPTTTTSSSATPTSSDSGTRPTSNPSPSIVPTPSSTNVTP